MARFPISKFTTHYSDDHDDGYDLCVDASEIGVPPGSRPPNEILVEMADGSTDKFDLCGRVFETVGGDEKFVYWSYWNSNPGTAVNIQVFND